MQNTAYSNLSLQDVMTDRAQIAAIQELSCHGEEFLDLREAIEEDFVSSADAVVHSPVTLGRNPCTRSTLSPSSSVTASPSSLFTYSQPSQTPLTNPIYPQALKEMNRKEVRLWHSYKRQQETNTNRE